MNDIRPLVQELREHLGARLVAYITGQDNTLITRRWAIVENVDIDPELVNKMELVLEVTYKLLEFDAPSTVQSWFIGCNPYLAEDSPAELIRYNKTEEVRDKILAAASDFIAGG